MQDEKRFYVYVHKLKETGEIFYIGKGSRRRLISKYGRPKSWYDVTSKNEWVAEKIITDLSNDEAINREVELIDKLKPICNTHRTDLKHKPIPCDFVKNRYKYDPLSKTGLLYLESNLQHGVKKRNAGDDAGTLNAGGYYTVSGGSVGNLMVHRVIWFLVKGEDPANFLIDHIDGDRTNNNINNLRKVTTFENSRNSKMRVDNASGIKGVFVGEDFCTSTWSDSSGIPRYKNFSCKKYGKDLAFALATYCRLLNLDSTFTGRHIGNPTLPVILKDYTEDEISKMIHCSARFSNSSGYPNVSLLKVGDHEFWTYTKANQSRRFSVKKFGKELALALCLEYKNRQAGQDPQPVLSFSIKETNQLLLDNTRSTNKSGFKGISFRVERSKTFVVAQKMINRKNYSKSFNCDVLGIIQAHALASKWYAEFTEKDVLCQSN